MRRHECTIRSTGLSTPVFRISLRSVAHSAWRTFRSHWKHFVLPELTLVLALLVGDPESDVQELLPSIGVAAAILFVIVCVWKVTLLVSTTYPTGVVARAVLRLAKWNDAWVRKELVQRSIRKKRRGRRGYYLLVAAACLRFVGTFAAIATMFAVWETSDSYSLGWALGISVHLVFRATSWFFANTAYERISDSCQVGRWDGQDPYVVYFRPFAQDTPVIPVNVVNRIQIEELLAATLDVTIVGLANPRGKHGPLGPVWIRTRDEDDWKRVALHLLGGARAVLVRLDGGSEALDWEVERALQGDLRERTIFMIPHAHHHPFRARLLRRLRNRTEEDALRWNRSRAFFERAFGVRLPGWTEVTQMIAFEVSARAEVQVLGKGDRMPSAEQVAEVVAERVRELLSRAPPRVEAPAS